MNITTLLTFLSTFLDVILQINPNQLQRNSPSFLMESNSTGGDTIIQHGRQATSSKEVFPSGLKLSRTDEGTGN